MFSVSITPSTNLHQCLLYALEHQKGGLEQRRQKVLKNWELLRETFPGRGRVGVVGLLPRPGAKSGAKQEKATLGSA